MRTGFAGARDGFKAVSINWHLAVLALCLSSRFGWASCEAFLCVITTYSSNCCTVALKFAVKGHESLWAFPCYSSCCTTYRHDYMQHTRRTQHASVHAQQAQIFHPPVAGQAWLLPRTRMLVRKPGDAVAHQAGQPRVLKHAAVSSPRAPLQAQQVHTLKCSLLGK